MTPKNPGAWNRNLTLTAAVALALLCLLAAFPGGGASAAGPSGAAAAASSRPGLDGGRSISDDTPMPAGIHSGPGFLDESVAGIAQTDGDGSTRGYLVWDGRGPWGGNVKSFATDPANALRILVACGLSAARESGGVWLSTDGGVNWVDTDLIGMPAYMVAPSLSEPGVFYAGYYDGLYRSTDSGAHWTRIAFTGQIIGTGVKADDGNVLIAGIASNQGIKRSTDRGVTWSTVGINTAFMKGFAVSPAAPNRMYLAMSSSTTSCWRSDDGGATWSASGPAGIDGWGLWADPADADHVYLSTDAGVYRTTNGGGAWTLVLPGTFYANVSVKDGVAYAPTVANAPSGAGVYESTDGGNTWTNYSGGLGATFFYASGATSTRVLAGHYGGIYGCAAPATSWVVSQTGLNNAYVRTISYYADRGELWAGTDQSGLWRSTDNGVTWEMKSTGLGDWALYRLTPQDHAHGQGNRMFVTTYTGVYRSTNFGETWQRSGFDGLFMRGILIDPANNDRVWTGGSVDQKIWRSEDAGATWQQVGSGITAGFYPDLHMGRNPLNGPRLFVNYEQMTNRIYYSDDLGTTFTAATGLESTTYQPSLTVRDANPSLVFAGTDIGVYKSTDYGATWAASGSSGVIWSLLGTRTTDIYAGRNRAGVSVSHDDGATWSAMNTGIETQVMWDICYGATTSDLFSSPRGRGVKRYSLENAAVAEPLVLRSALAPNPFRDGVMIAFARPLGADARVHISDTNGRVVFGDRIAAGSATWDWHGRDAAGRPLPSGTYFYEISDAAGRSTGRCTIAR